MVKVNEKILRLAKERGWSEYMLANKADITHSTLNSSINRDTPPKIDTLERICDAFGITMAQFFLEDEAIEFLSSEEKELIELYRRLPKEKREALSELLK